MFADLAMRVHKSAVSVVVFTFAKGLLWQRLFVKHRGGAVVVVVVFEVGQRARFEAFFPSGSCTRSHYGRLLLLQQLVVLGVKART